MPSLPKASPTHLAVMDAAINGTIYWRPPVSSNMMTTRETENRTTYQADNVFVNLCEVYVYVTQ